MERLGEDRFGGPGFGPNAFSVTRACTFCSGECVGPSKGQIRTMTGNLSRR